MDISEQSETLENRNVCVDDSGVDFDLSDDDDEDWVLESPVGNRSRRKSVATKKITNNLILDAAGIPSDITMTPEMNKLLQKCVDSERKIHKSGLHNILSEENVTDEIWLNINTLKSPFLRLPVLAAMSNDKVQINGYRYCAQLKNNALILQKLSTSAYKFLHSLMSTSLPSLRTMQRLSSHIKVDTGLDHNLLNAIKKKIVNMPEIDKYCCIMFDEMSLIKRFIYRKSKDNKDVVYGYKDLGNERRFEHPAQKAFVIMIGGLNTPYKQPIGYWFTSPGITTEELKVILTEVIKNVIDIGLKPVATVCDQGSTNRGAINQLKIQSNTIDKPFFYVDEQMEYPIHVIWDVPHLYKCFRNNFMGDIQAWKNEKNCKNDYEFPGRKIIYNNEKIAEWKYIKNLYLKDQRSNIYDKNLTRSHVFPRTHEKMRVKLAAQLVSQHVGNMLIRASSNYNVGSKEKEEMLQTGEVIKEIDQLYDSILGEKRSLYNGKDTRKNPTIGSDHINRWQEYHKKIKNSTIENSKGVRLRPPFLSNTAETLKSLEYLWTYLQNKAFKVLYLRQLNQDPVENFFGLLRHCGDNRYPDCSIFESNFKAHLVKHLSNDFKKNTNCEHDDSDTLLDLADLFSPDSLVGELRDDEENVDLSTLSINNENPCSPNNYIYNVDDILEDSDSDDTGCYHNEDNSYPPVIHLPETTEPDDKVYDFCEWETERKLEFGRELFKKLKLPDCTFCRKSIANIDAMSENPNPKLYQILNAIEIGLNEFENNISRTFHEKNVFLRTQSLFTSKISCNWISCPDKNHQLLTKTNFLTEFADSIIKMYCKSKNESFQQEWLNKKNSRKIISLIGMQPAVAEEKKYN